MIKLRKILALFMTACMMFAVLPDISLADETTDVIDHAFIGISGTNYSSWTDKEGASGAVYAGNSAVENDAIKLKSNNSSGIVTTGSAGSVTSIVVVWNSFTAIDRTLNVYGKNTVYGSAADLYGDNAGDLLGTIVCGTSTTLAVSGEYAYIGLRSADGAMYLDSIEIKWENEGSITPPKTYIVSFDAGEGSGEMEEVTDATSPYTLPECTFTAPEGKIFDGWVMAGGDGNVYASGTQVTLEEPNVTFIATWRDMVAKYYRLVTSADDLVVDGTYLIASEVFVDELYVMSNQTSNNRAQYKVAGVDGETITLDESWVAANTDDVLAFEFILGGDAESGWTFYDAVSGGYLYAAENDQNRLRTQTELDDNGRFIFELGEGGAALPVAQGENMHSHLHYNSESGIFSCYRAESIYTAPVYFYRLVLTTEVRPTFEKHSVLLSGQIGLTFYMNLPEMEGIDYSKSYMSYSIAHGDVTKRTNFSAENTYGSLYGFTCYVNSLQMAEPITAQFHYGNGQTVEETFSIKEYFSIFDDAVAAGKITDPKIIALTQSVANYGHYIQLFQAETKGWTLSEKYAVMDKFYPVDYDMEVIGAALEKYAIVRDFSSVGIDQALFSLVVDSETGIRVYYKIKSGYTGGFTATVDDQQTTVNVQSGQLIVDIIGIKANRLSKTYSIVVHTDSDSVIVKVSALSYAQIMLDVYDSDTARNAAAAIYAYAAAAADYID